MEVVNHCRNFLVFLEFLMREFPELLIEVKIKVVASGNSLLWTIRGVDASLMIAEMVFLIDLVILEILIPLEV
jgi:hypothetical protein